MFHTILVPLDGSHWSEQALPLAQRIAQQNGAQLLLAHVHLPAISMYLETWNLVTVPVIDDTLDAEARDRDRAYLADMQKRLTAETGLTVDTALLDGPISDTLTTFAAARHADLIVMTTHGRGAFGRFWIGSVADELIRQSCVPTLLVRPQEEQPSQPIAIHRVLIPLDGSPLAAQILRPAASLARLMHADLTLVQVIEPLHVPGSTMIDAADLKHQYINSRCAEAQAYLAGLAAPLRAQGLKIETHALVGGHVANDMLRFAREYNADLIALATHGRGGVQRLMLGSVADKIIRGADGPVLVYRPHVDTSHEA
jgi:nucleotide-binding universal stress UspA family protein